jgi:hypothetical protein
LKIVSPFRKRPVIFAYFAAAACRNFRARREEEEMGRVCVGCDSSKVPSDVFISAARRLNADNSKEHLVQKDMASTSKGLVYSEYSDAIVFPTRVIMTRINGGNFAFEEIFLVGFTF